MAVKIARRFTGEIPFRKAYIGSIVDRIEVDDHRVRIAGRKDVLEAAMMAIGGPAPGIRSLVRRWRTVVDRCANTYVIEMAL